MRFIHFIIFVINKFKWAISGVYIPNVDFFFLFRNTNWWLWEDLVRIYSLQRVPWCIEGRGVLTLFDFQVKDRGYQEQEGRCGISPNSTHMTIYWILSLKMVL